MLLDVHPRLSRARESGKTALIGDPNVPLLITEGIPKADAAITVGFCSVALLGVWNWRGSNDAGGTTALADWDSIALNERTIYVVFDSDVMVKPEVHAALARLKGFLESRKAIVKVIYLPCGDHGEKVGIDDFIAARKAACKSHGDIRFELLTLAVGELREPTGVEGAAPEIYRETPNGLVRVKRLQEGEVHVPLTNFTARIVADVTHDDGAETTRSFVVEAKQHERTAVVTVPVAQFPLLRWAVDALGAEAVIYAGSGTTDHARAAIQLLSEHPARRMVYAHTGWRTIANDSVYLHADGAIGAAGKVEGIEVSLPPELAPLKLEIPTDSVATRGAIAASLRLLDVGPDRITIPAMGAVWRTILGGPDFSIFLYGETGAFKTELAALLQQHFGKGFDARHLPTSFTSTANTNEALAFIAKDAVLVVDELHPPASGSQREAMHRDVDRLLRSQGNSAGRGRMRADGTLRPTKPPRGVLLATGEELPRRQSADVRMFILEVQKGAVEAQKLTTCQTDAAAGLYAQATAAFVRWLAAQFDEVRTEFQRLRREWRGQIHHDHARTADIRAQLTAAYSIFIAFLVETEVLDEDEAAQLQTRIGAALEETANAQIEFSGAVEPTGAFIRLLTSAIGAGRAHLADNDGEVPDLREAACGWRKITIGTGDNQRDEWQPQGDRVGWLDGDYVYLNRDAAYRVAQNMSADGTGIEVSAITLMRRLNKRGLLARVDAAREVLTMRQTIEGRRQEVVCMRASTLSLPLCQPDQPDHDGENGQGSGRESGRS